MISVIIPAYYKEEPYLNKTIENIFRTAEGKIEVIVALNGYRQEVDPRAKVVNLPDNQGERVAMNAAATLAVGDFLLRIDAHCDFYTPGWDLMMAEITGPKTITVAILTATYHHLTADAKQEAKAQKNGWCDWTRDPGHWYGMCRLMPNMEAKWITPNKERDYPTVVPNMAFTGCGWLIPTEFYWELGGADESMPKMGAIGEEFAVKAWLNGGKVQSRTDVIIGHIFGTGAYDTQGVIDALWMLEVKYGDRYQEIKDRFPDTEILPLRTAKHIKEKRTVIVDRTDTTDTKDADGNIIRRAVERYRYIWIDDETESDLTEEQIREKYAPLGQKIGEEVWIANDEGELVKINNRHHTRIPNHKGE